MIKILVCSIRRANSILILLLLSASLWSQSSQPGNGNTSTPCEISSQTLNPDGSVNLCLSDALNVLDASIACDGNTLDAEILQGDQCNFTIVVPCCPSGTAQVSWSEVDVHGTIHNCSLPIDTGTCGWTECHNVGAPCDDGDDDTVNDTINDDCVCQGIPSTPCTPDTDGDGICDEDDCWPNDATQSSGPGDACDDGNAFTVWDTINDNCECIGVPYSTDGCLDDDDGQPIITNVSFTEKYSEQVHFVGDIDTANFTIVDIMEFKTAEYTKDHHYFRDENGNIAHNSKINSSNNLFPGWFQIPLYSSRKKDGCYSYYDQNHKYLPGGWGGAHSDSTVTGIYIENPQSGLLYHYIPHSTIAEEAYDQTNDLHNEYGVLFNLSFHLPDTEVLNEYASLGFSVDNNGNVISVNRSDLHITWDESNHTLTTQVKESGQIKKTNKYSFKLNDQFGLYLLENIIEVKPGQFSTGDCFERISETIYSGYEDLCDAGSNLNDEQVLSSRDRVDKIKIYPNPALEEITINFPASPKSTRISIYDLNGQLILVRNAPARQDHHKLSISNLNPGMYLLKIKQGALNYSSKFVKK